jgi:hypothetical protein
VDLGARQIDGVSRLLPGFRDEDEALVAEVERAHLPHRLRPDPMGGGRALKASSPSDSTKE